MSMRIDRDGADADADFARSRLGQLDRLPLEDLGPARGHHHHRFGQHAARRYHATQESEW